MEYKKLKIGSINMRGYSSNYFNILSILSKLSYGFIMIQETMLTNETKKTIFGKKYKTLFNCNHNKKSTRGLAIIMRKDFILKKIINEDNNILIILTERILDGKKVIVGNCHAPNFNDKIKQNNYLDMVENLLKELKKKYNDISMIIGGDFNCSDIEHSTNYNSNLKKITSKFMTFNTGPTRKKNILDYFLVKNIVFTKIKNRNNVFLSDHNFISFTLIVKNKERLIVNRILIVKDFNVKKLQDFNLNNYKNTIYKCCNISTKEVSNARIFNQDILEIRFEIKITNNLKINNVEKKKKLKILKEKWKKLMKMNYKNLLKNLEKMNPFLFLKKKNKGIKDFIKKEDLKKICNASNENYDQSASDCYININKKKNKIKKEINQEITNMEFEEILKQIKKNKLYSAPGPDCINYQILTSIPIEKYKYIIEDFNLILNNKKEIPFGFADGNLIPVVKDENTTDFRPITCLNGLYKIFNLLLLNRIEKHKLKIEKEQKGFQKGIPSCDINLIIFYENLKKFRKIGGIVTCWDFASAFDSINMNYLKIILKKNYFSDNATEVIVNNMKSGKLIFKELKENNLGGCRQGNPISPIIFNLCINPLLKIIKKKCNSKILGYADDICTFCKDEKEFEKVNDLFLEFCNYSGMNINFKKTITGNNNLFNIKYLGITFSINKFSVNFNYHLKEKCKNLIERINEILKKRFIPINIIINYINSLYSMVLYGSFLFHSYKDLFDKVDKKIRTKIRKFLKIGLVENNVLFTILGLNNLTNLIKIEKIMSSIRIYKNYNKFDGYITNYSYNYGFPQLPMVFGEKTKDRSPYSAFNNSLLENNLEFISKEQKKYNYQPLQIRARKNIIKTKTNFYFKELKSWTNLKNDLGYKIKLENYNFLKKNLKIDDQPIIDIPSIVLKENNEKIIINKKNENKNEIRNKVKLIFQKKFFNKSFENTDLVSIGKTKLKKRYEIRNHLRLISNGFPTMDNLIKINKNDNFTNICCLCKDQEETIKHILLDCEGTLNIRKEFDIEGNDLVPILKETRFIQKCWKFRNEILHK
jgi:hypothetical protein